MTELKPCPFCGGENLFVGTEVEIKMLYEKIIQVYEECGYDLSFFAVCCDAREGGCGTVGGFTKTKEEAIEVWNRRADNDR